MRNTVEGDYRGVEVDNIGKFDGNCAERGVNAESMECNIRAKKLKQVRLPFKTLDPKLSSAAISSEKHCLPTNQKKRPLSDKDGCSRPTKSPKRSLDCEQENKLNLSAENVKKSNKKFTCKSANNVKVTDDEISSSCESDEHQQDPEVSTSCDFVENPICKRQVTADNKLLENENYPQPILKKDLIEGANIAIDTKDKSSNEIKSVELNSKIVDVSITGPEHKMDLESLECQESNSKIVLQNGQSHKDLCTPSSKFDEKSNFEETSKLELEMEQSQSSDEDENDITVTSVELDSSLAEERQSDSDVNPSTPNPSTDSAEKTKTKRQQERERIKQEKLNKMQGMKTEKIRQKKLLKQQREMAKAEKEVKRKQILEMKMEEKRKKEEDRLKKEEDRQKKEEERKKKEEERKMKEDEKKAKDEEKRQVEEMMHKKKQKVKMQFASFFVKKTTSSDKEDQQVDNEAGQFKPFQLTKGMQLAPITRAILKEKLRFDYMIANQIYQMLYVEEFKSGKHVPKTGERTFPPPTTTNEDKFDDYVGILDEITNEADFMADENIKLKLPRAKILQFHENRRPPYWGTFRKTSKEIRPRKPFGRDKDLFDYDVDSDDEWEEEEPGESLHGSDDDKESEDDYDEDGEFMVPHGYLSADEENEDPETINDPETQKQKLKLRAEEFQMDMKRSSQRHVKKPRIIGCIFMNSFDMSQELESNERVKFLQSFESVLLENGPIPSNFTLMPSNSENMNTPLRKNSPEAVSSKSKTPTSAKKTVPKEAMPFLIKLVHANPNSRSNLVMEFKEFWYQHCSSKMKDMPTEGENCPNNSPTLPCELSKRQIDLTIQSISSWCRYPNPEIYNRLCWVVSDDFIKEYNVDDLSAPNKWNYVTKLLSMKAAASAEQAVNTPVSTPKVNRITKFVQAISPQTMNLNENLSKSSNVNVSKMAKAGKFGQNSPSSSSLLKYSNENFSKMINIEKSSQSTSLHSEQEKMTVDNNCKSILPESEKFPKSPGPMMKFLKPTSSVQLNVNAVQSESIQKEVKVFVLDSKNEPAKDVKIIDLCNSAKNVENLIK
ncbi:Chromatin assembly factor 1 subunit A-B [Nymphon striatum]|nr:Chromatin assembly factor 1 subunit A-B [Nymphon striatum]